MTLQIVALVVLAGAFVLGTARPINLGAIALAATFVIGILVAGLSSDDAVSGFPVDLMLILVGVTYLFNVARANGTIDWLIASAIQMIGGRTVFIPWIMFALTALLSAIGAVFSPPIVAPIALAFAARHRIPQPMMGILVVHGAAAGSLSPISVYGVTVAGVLNKSGLPSDPWGLFALAFTASLLPAIAVFVVYGGLRLRRVEQGSGEDGGELPPPSGGTATATATAIVAKPALNVDIVLTSLAIAGMFVGAIMDLDVGLLAITLATLLALHRHEPHAAALRNVPWTLVLLVGGTITYVGVLEQIGAIELLGNSALAIGAPVATVLLLAYVAGIVSAFASSAGTIAALTPLAVPLLENSTLSVLPVVAVIAIAASIVDVSPFSGNGAAVIANATEDARERVYRTQLVYGGGVVLLAPVLLWLAVVLPSTG